MNSIQFLARGFKPRTDVLEYQYCTHFQRNRSSRLKSEMEKAVVALKKYNAAASENKILKVMGELGVKVIFKLCHLVQESCR